MQNTAVQIWIHSHLLHPLWVFPRPLLSLWSIQQENTGAAHILLFSILETGSPLQLLLLIILSFGTEHFCPQKQLNPPNAMTAPMQVKHDWISWVHMHTQAVSFIKESVFFYLQFRMYRWRFRIRRQHRGTERERQRKIINKYKPQHPNIQQQRRVQRSLDMVENIIGTWTTTKKKNSKSICLFSH